MAECPSCGDLFFGMTLREIEDHIADCGPAHPEIIHAYFDLARSKSGATCEGGDDGSV